MEKVGFKKFSPTKSEPILNKKKTRPEFARTLSWKEAVQKAFSLPDPWERFHIDEIVTEIAVRHRYNALKKTWVKDKVYVKMEDESFNKGAMRACFRMKKLSNFLKDDWKHAMNYVAKKYFEDVPRKTYFDDVRLQMDAKLWGEEYNRHNPPKKVDIFQVCVIEMIERDDSPLYHVEHFIEGTYIKYNSNSGFVDHDEAVRSTPQAFSHFTFERSGHKLIVVDIQGVGDLYTDPQIHTAEGQDYGEANLGTRGMALYFSSHQCNSICVSLGLSPFDLSEEQKKRNKQTLKAPKVSSTVVKGMEELAMSPNRKLSAIYDMTEYLEKHSPPVSPFSSPEGSLSSSLNSMSYNHLPLSPTDNGPRKAYFRMSSSEQSSDITDPGDLQDMEEVFASDHNSESGSSSRGEEDEEYRKNFYGDFCHRPSSVFNESEVLKKLQDIQSHKMEQQMLDDISESILGQVHLSMAKYHELGRFTEHEPDMESALYHMEQAAICGCTEALLTIAEIFLDLPHDLLENAKVEQNEENTSKGMTYMTLAAEKKDRGAMVYIAKKYESGEGLGQGREKSWAEAVRWFEEATKLADDTDKFHDNFLSEPNHVLYSRIAAMYREGGFGLEKDPQSAGDFYNSAADAAMAQCNGKLATKFYMLSEECWGEMEEEEEEN